jgi:hypothetical protein
MREQYTHDRDSVAIFRAEYTGALTWLGAARWWANPASAQAGHGDA